MNHVERFRRVMSFQPVDRLPIIEWAGWWDQTLARWRGEGLPRELAEDGRIRDYLGLDPCRQHWISSRGPDGPQPASRGAPLIANAADYDRIREHLFPREAFNRAALEARSAPHARGEMVLWFTLDGFFWFPRVLFGIEPHLYAFHDQPELMKRINADLAEFHLRAIDEFCKIATPEFMTFAEDMSYNHGPMLSRECFDEFLLPFYRRVVPALEARGILPLVDSDGDVTELIGWLEAAGVRGLLPLERMAGVDVARIRREHPRFLMIGAFDKTVMKEGEPAMRREFERLLPAMRAGGFIPSVDHQTPPDVSLDTYRLYVRLLGEYAARGAERA